MDSIADLVFMMRDKGVRVWSEQGQVRYRSLSRTPDPQDIELLKARKAEIVSFFEEAASCSCEAEPKLLPRLPSDEIPLTFTQRSFWQLLDLDRKPSVLMACWPTRISGPLNIEALRSSVAMLVRRHESLRTRIVLVNGVPKQQIDDSRDYGLSVIDLSRHQDEERTAELDRLVKKTAWAPVDLAVDPLFVAKLYRLGPDEHVLVIAMDHLIEDGATGSILRRELWGLYQQSVASGPLSLPRIPIQFADYAVWLQKCDRFWIEKHGGYWSRRLAGARRLRLFADDSGLNPMGSKWGSLKVLLGKYLIASLRELSRQEQTTLSLTVLTAYAATLMRWSDTKDVVIPVITVARPFSELSNTVGFFGAALFLRMEMWGTESLRELLARVTTEHSTACVHHDFGRIAAQSPQLEVVLNPAFNWFPEEFDWSLEEHIHCEAHGMTHQIRIQPMPTPFENPPDEFDLDVDSELGLGFFDSQEEVRGFIGYRADRVSAKSVERFETTFRLYLEALVKSPDTLVTAIPYLK
jgi:hypothetical protein